MAEEIAKNIESIPEPVIDDIFRKSFEVFDTWKLKTLRGVIFKGLLDYIEESNEEYACFVYLTEVLIEGNLSHIWQYFMSEDPWLKLTLQDCVVTPVTKKRIEAQANYIRNNHLCKLTDVRFDEPFRFETDKFDIVGSVDLIGRDDDRHVWVLYIARCQNHTIMNAVTRAIALNAGRVLFWKAQERILYIVFLNEKVVNDIRSKLYEM